MFHWVSQTMCQVLWGSKQSFGVRHIPWLSALGHNVLMLLSLKGAFARQGKAVLPFRFTQAQALAPGQHRVVLAFSYNLICSEKDGLNFKTKILWLSRGAYSMHEMKQRDSHYKQREAHDEIPCPALSRSVVSKSLQPHGLQPARLLCP